MPSYTFTPSILRGAGTRAVPEIPAGSSSTFLVDQFSTNIFGAYSLRKLSSTYTGSAIQVQIGSSGATFNAGFDSNGYLDTASIAAFNTANAQLFLENWYDQSGNVNNMDGNQTGRRLQVTDVSGSFFTSSNGNIRLYMNESSKGTQYINNVASSSLPRVLYLYLVYILMINLRIKIMKLYLLEEQILLFVLLYYVLIWARVL